MARISSLPYEICSLIIRYLDSPSDLYHLIQGSSTFARVFWGSREACLSTILMNMLSKETLSIVLITLSIPAAQPGDTKESHQEAVKSFIANSRNYLKEISSFDCETLTCVFRRHSRIRRFMEHFAALALSNQVSFMTEIEMEPLPWWADITSSNAEDARAREVSLSTELTNSETERFQLGFYRHELLCQIFPVSCTSPKYEREQDSLFSGQEQFDLLISTFPVEWIESLNCIHQYFMGMVGKIFDQVEEEFVTELVALDIGRQDSSNLLAENVEDAEVTRAWREEVHKRKYSNFEPHHVRWHLMNARYAASLGVDYIYDLVNSAQTQRLELARQSMDAHREFLAEALEDANNSTPNGYFKCNEPDGSHVCRYDCEQLAYMIDATIASGLQYFQEREIAFVFWDLWRIESDPTFDGLRRLGIKSSRYKHMRAWPRSGIPTTERLIDILVRRDELEAVLDRYRPSQDMKSGIPSTYQGWDLFD